MSGIIATEAAVHAALDTLDRRGEKPTQRRVIEILGGGSFSTVTRYCQTWQPKETPVADIGPVPEPVAIQARQLVNDLWMLSGAAAEKRANERVRQLESKLQRSETSREELATILDDLTAECEALKPAASERDEWKARCVSIQAERDALQRIVDHISGGPKKNRQLKVKRSHDRTAETTPSAQS
jgi:hypothetical protein